ncbi:MAG TPA: TetR/AcrR family transcriptional regulator [Ferruginibacter sp.]|nr:TetR/AcrR family transcriptional regulator [Ferruginibacter sp.]HRN80559.1 TetR/AcrR family transcriptional regulator [Ferruginibacter sp.]HRO17852.1 TetR/AcrR family transcriptional regulator [Ferruginibacter sp.]HRQ21278.1 TetR/AcrR family transcriptional regulator [Ferruginibacter sp.]
MEFKLSFPINESVYIKNPDHSDIGRKIIKHGIDLINELGFEHFTFKKLAIEIGTTEATVYRYFENKHRLLLYIISWYWFYLDYLMDYRLQNMHDPKKQLEEIIQILTHELPESSGGLDYNKKYLNNIVVAESSKVYLVKEIESINQEGVFKAYKDLCRKMATVMLAYNPTYKYPHSLSSTIVETAHYQQYFVQYLPRLTDANDANKKEYANVYLTDLLFKVLG